jgi:hypothetical protein
MCEKPRMGLASETKPAAFSAREALSATGLARP